VARQQFYIFHINTRNPNFLIPTPVSSRPSLFGCSSSPPTSSRNTLPPQLLPDLNHTPAPRAGTPYSGRARRWPRCLPISGVRRQPSSPAVAATPPHRWPEPRHRPLSPRWPGCCAAASSSRPCWSGRRHARLPSPLSAVATPTPPLPPLPADDALRCAPALAPVLCCSVGPGVGPSGRFRRRAGPARKTGYRAVPGPPVGPDARHGPARRSYRAA
jgi:hypothetical protein